MKIGVMIGGTTTDELIEKAKKLENQGFDSVWMANFIGYGLETLHAMGLIAHETEQIKLGTAVIPIYSHHPFALAHQAISIQQTAQGRFTLGIGLSHPFIINEWFGFSSKKPIAQIREYLSILRPLLNREAVTTKGSYFSATAEVHVPHVEKVPLLIAAMGSQMLKVAGTMADGTVTYLTGLHTLGAHIIPRIQSAAATEGQASPQIVASGLPIALVKDRDAALAAISEKWAGYADLPSYRAMFDKEGVSGAEGVSLVGDRETLKAALQKLEDMGVTEFVADTVAVDDDTIDRTLDFLASQL